jgi:hypothetical protein
VNTKSSFVLLDMCGYKTRYFKDLKAIGKKQTSTNPTELAITRLIQYLSQATRNQTTDKTIGQYKKIVPNRKLSLVLNVNETLQLAQIQPVLNLV